MLGNVSIAICVLAYIIVAHKLKSEMFKTCEPEERIRKAVIAYCWLPLFITALVMLFMKELFLKED